ncbi:hypothetical protein CM50_07705 [Bacillus subtilis]|nr:hypothetical protein CM50_07705 [Bacillus subtilis] [Bacillus stercoris]
MINLYLLKGTLCYICNRQSSWIKSAGSAVKVSSKIAKTGATKVDKVLEAGEKTATNHINKGISKGKNTSNLYLEIKMNWLL